MSLSARQNELADAGLAIVAEAGMSAVSFRSVASAAGWSLGAVQKAFASKDELVRAMFIRLRESAQAIPPGEPGRPRLRSWLVELFIAMLPLDDRRRALTLQGAAFGDRAPFDPAVGRAIAASDAELRRLLAALISRAQSEGEVNSAVDANITAWTLLGMANGWAAQLLYDPLPQAEVRHRLDLVIAQLLPSD